jgi:hypothetical protein
MGRLTEMWECPHPRYADPKALLAPIESERRSRFLICRAFWRRTSSHFAGKRSSDISGLDVDLDETGSAVGLDIDRASKRPAA